jgi:hypothetical protein
VRELVIDDPPGANFTLGDIAWEVDPSAHEAVESLRILIQNLLLSHDISPSDLNGAWDSSGDRTLDKREFVKNVRRLFRRHPDLWQRDLHRVAAAAFTIIQADGADVDATAMVRTCTPLLAASTNATLAMNVTSLTSALLTNSP